MAVLKATKVVKEFPPPTKNQPTVRALDGLEFELSGQTFVTMVGPSGCGKSTFLNIVSGVETPTSGSILVKADDGSPATLGYVFQDPRLLPWRTVIDNLMYVHRDKSDENRERVSKYLDMVGLARVRADVPGPPLGRDAAEGGDRPRLLGGARPLTDGRAVQPSRRHHGALAP